MWCAARVWGAAGTGSGALDDKLVAGDTFLIEPVKVRLPQQVEVGVRRRAGHSGNSQRSLSGLRPPGSRSALTRMMAPHTIGSSVPGGSGRGRPVRPTSSRRDAAPSIRPWRRGGEDRAVAAAALRLQGTARPRNRPVLGRTASRPSAQTARRRSGGSRPAVRGGTPVTRRSRAHRTPSLNPSDRQEAQVKHLNHSNSPPPPS
jgi:hypothetical protein